VPDVRPYLWNAQVSIVPLRIGGGTRLKIYEAVAARRPVVSTTIGAEGLGLRPGEEILLADAPEAFAQACLRLLADAEARERIQSAAWNTVSRNYSWERVTAQFEEILEQNRIREAVR
jgi:glycosyltransferase involved in cell wall biosynthesis